MREAKWPSPSG